MMRRNIKAFDWAVSFYDYTRAVPADLLDLTVNTLQSHIPFRSKTRILVIGVGSGRLAIPLCRKTSASLVGLDLSEKMISRCKNKLESEVTDLSCDLLVADGEFLPFSKPFDIILTSHLLHLVPNPYTFLESTLEYLKPQGSYVNCEIFVNYQDTLPFQIFYKKLAELGYRYYFKWEMIRKGVKIFLKGRGWNYTEYEHSGKRKLSINDLVRFLREKVFSHHRIIPDKLYNQALSQVYLSLQELCINPASEVDAPAYSKMTIFQSN